MTARATLRLATASGTSLGGECLGYGLSDRKPVVDSLGVQSSNSRPFAEDAGFAVVGDVPMANPRSSRECLFFVHPTVKAFVQSVVMDSDLFAPFHYRKRFSVERGAARSSSVERLLLLSGPSTVRREVPKVIVDSFNRMFGSWLHPHIIQKRGEGLSPFRANLNAPSPVVLIVHILGIMAPSLHVLPTTVLRTIRTAMSSWVIDLLKASTRKLSAAEGI